MAFVMVNDVTFDPPDVGAFLFEDVVFEADFIPYLIKELLFPGLHRVLQ